MKSSFFLCLLTFMVTWFIFHEDKPEIETPKEITIHSDVGAYDWENGKEYTKAQTDSMIFSGGHWYTKKEFKTSTHYQKEPKWIRPAGKERSIRKNQAAEREWRSRQEESLTEDDVRDIIRTEYER